MKKRINIAAIVDKMQTAVQHLASLCPRNRFFTLLLAVANSSLFTLHSSLFISCSSDEASEAPAVQYEIPLSVSASAMLYEDGPETRGMTRRTSWTAPTGYYLYEALYDGTYENLPNLNQSTISLFMTHDNAVGDATTAENPLHARLRYSPSPPPSTSQWKLSLPNKVKEEDVNPGNYYAYGFIPGDAADDAIIAKLPEHSNWADGAVLTIHGLKAVAADPCVIIGAKHGFSEDYDGDYIDDTENGTIGTYNDGIDTRTNRLRAGDFKFHLNTGKRTIVENEVSREEVNPNYLYFLFDHLYSALSISMRVHADYYALRSIKLKALYLKTKTFSGDISEKTDVVITVERKNQEANPITAITYTPSADETKSDSTVYRNNAGFPLTTEYSSFLGHFMPHGITTLILTSVYDVYDTKGNLIRKDCKATNTMLLKDLLTEQEEAKRGWRYQVNMTINPTYLYVLSEPDLDNPTVVVN